MEVVRPSGDGCSHGAVEWARLAESPARPRILTRPVRSGRASAGPSRRRPARGGARRRTPRPGARPSRRPEARRREHRRARGDRSPSTRPGLRCSRGGGPGRPGDPRAGPLVTPTSSSAQRLTRIVRRPTASRCTHRRPTTSPDRRRTGHQASRCPRPPRRPGSWPMVDSPWTRDFRVGFAPAAIRPRSSASISVQMVPTSVRSSGPAVGRPTAFSHTAAHAGRRPSAAAPATGTAETASAPLNESGWSDGRGLVRLGGVVAHEVLRLPAVALGLLDPQRGVQEVDGDQHRVDALGPHRRPLGRASRRPGGGVGRAGSVTWAGG